MSGTSKNGFTLLEILVVMVLISIMATFVVPNFIPRRAGHERELFASNLSALIHYAWQRAVQYQKPHRVFFDLEHRLITIQEQTDAVDSQKKPIYEPITTLLKHAQLAIPTHFEIQQLFINGTNELRADRNVFKVWFYCMPSGMVQAVIINILDTRLPEHAMSLVVNPFTAQSTVYDSYQKP